MATRALTQRRLETIKPAAVRREYPDGLVPGLFFIVQPSGARSWAVRYRHAGTPAKLTLGGWPVLGLGKARELARDAVIAAKQGRDPGGEKKQARARAEAAAANTLRAVAEEYLAREGKKLRTADQRRATFERLIFPRLGKVPVAGIKRSDIVRLLDHVEDERGACMADEVLATLRKTLNWFASRDDEFKSPIVRGMARTKPKERARDRVLDDEELARVWATAETTPGPFGAFIQFTLLCATRRNESAHMTRAELSNGDWVIPGRRYKGKHDHLIPLSGAAKAVLDKVPAHKGCDYVFTTDGRRPISGFSKFKLAFDKACGVTGWRIHDLRRSARGLMSRAGISADTAERALGHVMPTIRQTYDKYSYRDEKKHAFEALAQLIQQITSPQENVVPLRR